MRQDEIIEMAKEAGFHEHDFPFKKFKFEAFAKLVADKEREACANLFSQPHMEYFGRDIQDAIRARGQE